MIYVSPITSKAEVELLSKMLGKFAETHNQPIVILKDFNISNYSPDTRLPTSTHNSLSQLLNFFSYSNFQQHNHIPKFQ